MFLSLRMVRTSDTRYSAFMLTNQSINLKIVNNDDNNIIVKNVLITAILTFMYIYHIIFSYLIKSNCLNSIKF